jgi:hypothetical protein
MELENLQPLIQRELQRRISSEIKVKLVPSSDNNYTVIAMLPVSCRVPITSTDNPTHELIDNIADYFNKHINDITKQQNQLLEQHRQGFPNIYKHHS